MVSKKKQQISEFIDGLPLSEQMLNELASSDELKQDFEHYHLIGDVMRDELPHQLDLNFASKVAAAVELEPTILAPKAKVTDKLKRKQAEVIPFFGKLGQYGIAASVAAALVIGVQQLDLKDSQNPSAPVLQTVPVGGFVSPVSLSANTNQELQQRNEQKQRLEQRRQVNAYIQDHVLQQRLKSQVDEQKSMTQAQEQQQQR
jgi:sigma-E factor negative regulatory protein RseA